VTFLSLSLLSLSFIPLYRPRILALFFPLLLRISNSPCVWEYVCVDIKKF
jgi:hypothetical protein